MKKNTTESKLRKASKKEMDVPPAFVWDNIEEELHPKESNRKFIFWWIGSAIIAILFIVIFTNIDQDKNNSTANIATSNSPISEENILVTKETKIVSSIENNKNEVLQIDASDNQSKISAPLQQQQQQQQQLTNNTSTSSKRDISSYNIRTQKTIKENDIAQIRISENIASTVNSDINIKNNNPLEEEINALIQIPNLIVEESENKNRINYVSQSIGSIVLKNLIFDRKKIPYHNCPKFDKKIEFKPFVEFGVLGGIHNIGLSQNNNSALYNLRKDSESSWYSTGLYGNVGLNISNNWHASIGAEWTMSKDRFESKIDGITKMIVTFDPTNGTAIDTSFVSGSLYNKGDITFHFIDIPMNLGYTLSKGKWKYGIELSTLLNIKTFSEGKIYNETEGISSLKKEDNIYKNSVGLGFKSSLLFARELNNNLSVQVKPSFKTYLNEINNESYSLPTKYRMFSISVGLKKNF